MNSKESLEKFTREESEEAFKRREVGPTIVDQLQRFGRQGNSELAQRVGVTNQRKKLDILEKMRSEFRVTSHDRPLQVESEALAW